MHNLFNLQECLLCNRHFCSEHAQPFDFPAGALPDNVSRAYICSTCRPQAEHIAADHKDGIKLLLGLLPREPPQVMRDLQFRCSELRLALGL